MANARFCSICYCCFSAIYFFILRDSFQDTNDFELIPTLIFGVFGVFFLVILGYMASILIKDFNAGAKNCYEGIVEDKKLNIKQSTFHSRSHDHRDSSNSKTNKKRYYYIIVEGIEHEIEYNMYLQVKVGDLVYFEVAPKSRTVLFYEVLENTAVETKTEAVRFDTVDYQDS
ncbi:hypothetical protein [Kordia sp.]|uniref:hypothetical protein n=1 Tax=Kordia sp. TaxID=1965332 RepID=UPI0025C5F050|nr:hypothetical protein [Kordia sp.]MCH2195560.1 hypothetical protein [Kordia sp.]